MNSFCLRVTIDIKMTALRAFVAVALSQVDRVTLRAFSTDRRPKLAVVFERQSSNN